MGFAKRENDYCYQGILGQTYNAIHTEISTPCGKEKIR